MTLPRNDRYFNGGTAPWFAGSNRPAPVPAPAHATPVSAANPSCAWSGAIPNAYLAGCAQNCASFATLAEAQAACAADGFCGGVTVEPSTGRPELRASIDPQASPSGETSYVITNEYACHAMPPDPQWLELGAAAYRGLANTDPDAIWSFQVHA